ncbi:MAG: acyl transferase [Bacteroidales bacterium]|nr:acyl transferase [Bacteroidales bacterium]
MNANDIFNINNSQAFEKTALNVFKLQYDLLPLYRSFCDSIQRTPQNVSEINQIPFLPIQFFRTHEININPSYDILFESSGTTQPNTSRHYVADKQLYKTSFKKTFELFYGPSEDFVWLALMPSVSERKHSSLVYMTDYFIRHSKHSESGFYLNRLNKLYQTILTCIEQKKKIILLGLSYALLDFAENYSLPTYENLIVMETGGMKGKRPEMVRQELHTFLIKALNVTNIHSEYGMTELLSQAYSKREGLFRTPPWMKVLIRDVYNPLNIGLVERNGGINIIDLANIYSCAFIETEDMGMVHTDGSFEVIGRMENTINRGCNMLI